MFRDGVLINRGNFLDDSSYQVLQITADIASKYYPRIEKDEFIQVGWMRVIRKDYTRDPGELQRKCLQCFRRYAAEYWRKNLQEQDFPEEVWEVLPVDNPKNPSYNLMLEECLILLDLLEPEEKKLILWRLWDGLGFNEIGKLIGMHQQTARCRYHDAIARLRRLAKRKIRNVSNFHLAFQKQAPYLE